MHGELVDEDRALPAGTVTFLLTDVEGSSPMWEASPRRMAAAMRRHEEILSSAVAAYGGTRPLEQGEGDNVVAVFARASDAAAAARDAQLALAREEWPEGVELRVRMALHTGEAHLLEGRTYAGPDLNRCARLRALAHGGQTVVSRTTHALLMDSVVEGVTFLDLGAFRLRGLERVEHVHQLCHPELAAQFPPLHDPVGQPSNLPLAVSSLVGRVEEHAAIVALLSDARLVTLTGSGGCGKTRLAVEVGHALRPRFPDGVWWVDLASVADPGLVSQAVLSAIGGRDEPGRDPLEALTTLVRGREILIVIDNAEHLLDECASLASAVLEEAEHVRLLVTSREPIGINGEWVWRVPSLSLPDEGSAVATVRESDAARLFEQRARQVRADFQITDDNASAVTGICRRLDGMPLAIELAAARMGSMSSERIAAGLDDRFRLLTGGRRRAVPRHQTLQASVEWSHSLLEPNERAALRRMSVFVGGFSISAATSVVTSADLDIDDALDVLTRLVDKSLVVADGSGDEPRYNLLETIRQFAHDRLADAGEIETTRDRHLAWCVMLAAEAEPELTGPGQHAWLHRLEREHDNLRAALDWAAASGDGASLWSVAGNLPLFWVLHGHFIEAGETIERAISIGVDVPIRNQHAGRWASAYTAFFAGDFERAKNEAIDLIAQTRSSGDERYLRRALNTLGSVEMFGDVPSARAHLEEASDLARSGGDDYCLCEAQQVLANTYFFQDNHAAAQAALSEARPVAERLSSPQALGWDHVGVAWTAFELGHLAESRASAEAAFVLPS